MPTLANKKSFQAKVVERVEDCLNGRSGLGWDNLDEETLQSVRDEVGYEICRTIREELDDRIIDLLELP
jgi:hypothetical protein